MKTLRALFSVFVLVAAVYAAWLVIPPYFSNYRFQDAIESEARLNAYNNKPEEEIRQIVAKKARECDVPLQPEQINVMRSGPEISIWADYTVHVDLPGYPLDLKFHPSTKTKRI
jgi:hypothetical protein